MVVAMVPFVTVTEEYMLKFSTTHFSDYAIVYEETVTIYIQDIGGKYCKTNITVE